MAREIKPRQEYTGRLLKLIPSEIIAAYLFTLGPISKAGEDVSKWGGLIVVIVLLAIVPLYLIFLQKVKRIGQIIIATIAFVVWVYSLPGSPFDALGIYQPWLGSAIIALWTLVLPLVYNPKS